MVGGNLGEKMLLVKQKKQRNLQLDICGIWENISSRRKEKWNREGKDKNLKKNIKMNFKSPIKGVRIFDSKGQDLNNFWKVRLNCCIGLDFFYTEILTKSFKQKIWGIKDRWGENITLHIFKLTVLELKWTWSKDLNRRQELSPLPTKSAFIKWERIEWINGGRGRNLSYFM